jgi:hypothetical protein
MATALRGHVWHLTLHMATKTWPCHPDRIWRGRSGRVRLSISRVNG